MANFNVTTTEILGTDSMNNSRVTINNNFKSLAETINSIGNYFPGVDQFGTSTMTITASSITASNVIAKNFVRIGNTTLNEQQLIVILNHLNNQ